MRGGGGRLIGDHGCSIKYGFLRTDPVARVNSETPEERMAKAGGIPGTETAGKAETLNAEILKGRGGAWRRREGDQVESKKNR